MIHPVTAATASENPLSTRPGDWVYEADDVSFNLSAAHRCLEETRRTVAALRDGNRHRSGSSREAPRSSSRSRSPQRNSDMADRRGVTQNPLQNVLLALPLQLPWASPSGETLDPHPLKPGSPMRDQHPSCALPMRKNLWPSAASALHASGATDSPTAHMPLQSMASWMHRYSRIASQTLLGSVISQARSLCLQVVLELQLLASRLYRCTHLCLEILEAALMTLWSIAAPASKSRSQTAGPPQISASPSTPTCSRPGPNSRGSLVSCMQQLIILVCLHPACAGSRAEARVAAHATEAAGGIHSCFTGLPASMPKQEVASQLLSRLVRLSMRLIRAVPNVHSRELVIVQPALGTPSIEAEPSPLHKFQRTDDRLVFIPAPAGHIQNQSPQGSPCSAGMPAGWGVVSMMKS